MHIQRPTTKSLQTTNDFLNTDGLDTLKQEMQQLLFLNEQLLTSFKSMSLSTNKSASFPSTETNVA